MVSEEKKEFGSIYFDHLNDSPGVSDDLPPRVLIRHQSESKCGMHLQLLMLDDGFAVLCRM